MFDISIEQFNKLRFEDKHCVSCKKLGGHVYGTQKYDAALGVKAEVFRFMENTWRGLALGSISPKLTAKIGGWLYERPGKHKVTA